MPVNPKKRSTPEWQKHEYELDKKLGHKAKAHKIREKARKMFDEAGIDRKGMHIAHKKAIANGGTDDPSNLELETPDKNLHFHRKSNHKPVK